MYKRKIGVLLILLSVCWSTGFAQIDDFQTIVDSEKAAWIRTNVATERGKQPDAINRSDVKYARLHWEVDPAKKYIKGQVMTVFEPTEPLSTLEFDFSAALTMDSIRYHAQQLLFDHMGDIVRVHFPSALPPEIADSITFYYQGAPTATGFGSFVANQHKGVPVLWTLSEPYGAKEWWPCKQALNDKIDSVDIFITNPDGYRAASNGILVSETSANGHTTAHWKHRYPIAAYLICMAVTNYVEYQDIVPHENGAVTVLNYVYPESEVDAKIGTSVIVAQMQLFNDLFGMYPFSEEKYGHAEFGWGGGMEHQTMTFVSGWGFELLGHELAHHWFGDKVTCGSWEDIWLNEGFATYLSGLCYEHLRPQDWHNFKQVRINSAVSAPDGSVRVNDTSTVSRIFSGRLSYAKGAMVLHMLRWVCGDSAFFAGVRNYLNDPALAYGYARTHDLKRHMEQAANRNLDEFFADWFEGEGYPSYKINWSNNENNLVTIKVGQSQSHPSVAFYEMPLEIKLSDGTTDTTLVLYHTSNGQVFELQLGFKPTELVFDPNLWLVSRNNFVLGAADKGPFVLEIVPNPSPKDIQVQLTLPFADDAKVSLWQADGKLVYSGVKSFYQGLNEFLLEGKDRASGWHRLRIEGNNWEAVKTVLVH